MTIHPKFFGLLGFLVVPIFRIIFRRVPGSYPVINGKGTVAESGTIITEYSPKQQRYAICNLGAKITPYVKICGEGRILSQTRVMEFGRPL